MCSIEGYSEKDSNIETEKGFLILWTKVRRSSNYVRRSYLKKSKECVSHSKGLQEVRKARKSLVIENKLKD